MYRPLFASQTCALTLRVPQTKIADKKHVVSVWCMLLFVERIDSHARPAHVGIAPMCSHARSRLRLPIAGCACELCRRPYGEHWLKLERYREDQHGRCARMLAHIEKSTPSLTQQSALRSRWLVADLAHDVGALVGRRWWWRAVPGWVGEGWGVREGFGVGSGLRGCRHGWTLSRFLFAQAPGDPSCS